MILNSLHFFTKWITYNENCNFDTNLTEICKCNFVKQKENFILSIIMSERKKPPENKIWRILIVTSLSVKSNV